MLSDLKRSKRSPKLGFSQDKTDLNSMRYSALKVGKEGEIIYNRCGQRW